MTLFEESGFSFNFSGSNSAFRADTFSYNGLSAVDFIVETSTAVLFIEVKNPDNEKAKHHPEREELLSSPDEFSTRIAKKFKDSLLKEFAKGRRFPNPIVCILLHEFAKFDARQKLRLHELINGQIPRFAEDEFIAVNGICFWLCNREKFVSKYNTFSVTQAPEK